MWEVHLVDLAGLVSRLWMLCQRALRPWGTSCRGVDEPGGARRSLGLSCCQDLLTHRLATQRPPTLKDQHVEKQQLRCLKGIMKGLLSSV